jgi:hypothetical protein
VGAAVIFSVGTIHQYFIMRYKWYDEQINRVGEQIKRTANYVLLWPLSLFGVGYMLYSTFGWLTTIPLWAAAIIAFPIVVLLFFVCREVWRKNWDEVGRWMLLMLFFISVAFGIRVLGKALDWSVTTDIKVFVGYWLLLLGILLFNKLTEWVMDRRVSRKYNAWRAAGMPPVFAMPTTNADRKEQKMRTAGIWICGLLASAIVGGIVGSRFDETSSLYGGTIYWLWGILAGLLTFACVRLWTTTATTTQDRG